MKDTAPAIGPQVGAPPSQENVPIGLLQVDPAYQRATDGPASRRIIAAMVARWDWKLYQPLTVARRADGSLFIIDGQHRHRAAVERGDIMFLPCALQSSLDLQGEADTFIRLNTQRQALSQSDIFHGQLARGDADARRLQDMLDEIGWTVRRSTNSALFNAGDLNCAPMLVKRMAAGEEDTVRFALVTLRSAYPDTPVRSIATFLKALMELPDRLDGDDVPDPADIARLLARSTPDEWSVLGAEVRGRNRTLSNAECLAIAIARAADGTTPPPPPPPAPVRPASAFTRQPHNPFTLEGGAAWCSQCEQRCTRTKAANCKDRFCKLKGFL